jgi:hypothetical protein
MAVILGDPRPGPSKRVNDATMTRPNSEMPHRARRFAGIEAKKIYIQARVVNPPKILTSTRSVSRARFVEVVTWKGQTASQPPPHPHFVYDSAPH